MKPPCDEAVIRSASADAPCAAKVGPWILAAGVLRSSMAFVDSIVVNVALPTLRKSLGATVVDVATSTESLTKIVQPIEKRELCRNGRKLNRCDCDGHLDDQCNAAQAEESHDEQRAADKLNRRGEVRHEMGTVFGRRQGFY